MDIDSIRELLERNIPNSEVLVTGDGRHFEARVISPLFEGMSLIQRQRIVYQYVGDYLREGTLHALSIKAKTPSEWQDEIKK